MKLPDQEPAPAAACPWSARPALYCRPVQGSWFRILELRAVPSGAVLDISTTTSQNVKRFRGGLVFKAHSLLHHSPLGSRVIKKKKKSQLQQPHALGQLAPLYAPVLLIRV